MIVFMKRIAVQGISFKTTFALLEALMIFRDSWGFSYF